MLNVLLISTYEMGRQPFGLASPAAWLRRAGFAVSCQDLAVESLAETAVRRADLIAFYVPMHMATRLAAALIERVRALNPQAHLCFYGLYAPVAADYLRASGVDSFIGGEFEGELVALARRLAQPQPESGAADATVVSLARQQFLLPERDTLPGPEQYVQLVTADGRRRPTGYVEASRGCKHLCRHCPIVPVYNGRFRIVQRDVVLADIAQQVAAGARHITFGDPDFFNGPGHVVPLLRQMHGRFPDLTYDVTIKVEHLRRHADLLPLLKETGCLFVTSAVESFDPRILDIFDKRHTGQEFEAVLDMCRRADLLLMPTFVAFTPWTTLAGYRHFLAEIARLQLVEQVAPIQLTIRLLIPPGSRLLTLPEVGAVLGDYDAARFSYQWRNPEPALDDLQRQLERLVQAAQARGLNRRQIFQQVWQLARTGSGQPAWQPWPDLPAPASLLPHLTEPWYC